MIPAKEDPAATAMMRALRSQPVPAPGEVLRLDGGADFVMHLRLRGLYIRDCYKQLADLMLTEPPLDYILTGTPGTGKSLLTYYFLGRLLHLPQPPPFIVWQHVLKHNRRYCYDVKTGEVRVGGLDRFEEVELANPDTWYITDGVPPDVGVRARILLITPPKRETYKEMEKASAVKLFMPLWSLEELQDCRSKVGIPVPEALVTKFFQYCGGVALYSLEQQRPATNKTFDALLDNLRGAVNACNVAQVRAAIEGAGARDMGPESIHRVIHITTDASYSRRQLVFASPWVAERFVGTALMNGDERGLMSLVNGTTGSLRGMLHEAWMHMLLPKGGGFTVAPVDFPDGMEELQRGPEQRLKLPKCKGVALFEDVADIAGERCCEGVYYRPSSSPAFPLVDSLLCAGGALYLFQMTVGGSKIADFAALEELLRKLSLASQPEPRLIFVVPEDVYATFKLSVKVGDVDNKGQAAVVEGGWTQATAEAAAAASAKGRPRRTPAPALAPVPAPVPAPAVARPKLYIMKVPLATRTKPNVRAAVFTQRGRPAARMLGGLQW